MTDRVTLPERHAARRHDAAIAVDMPPPVSELRHRLHRIDRRTSETVAIAGGCDPRLEGRVQLTRIDDRTVGTDHRNAQQARDQRHVLVRLRMDRLHGSDQCPRITLSTIRPARFTGSCAPERAADPRRDNRIQHIVVNRRSAIARFAHHTDSGERSSDAGKRRGPQEWRGNHNGSQFMGLGRCKVKKQNLSHLPANR